MRAHTIGQIPLLVCSLGVLGVGCRGQEPEEFPVEAEREPYEELATAADTSGAFETAEPIGVVAVQGGTVADGALTATGNLRGAGNGEAGAVTVTHAASGTVILLTITGYEMGSELQAALVAAPCGEPGRVVELIGTGVTVPAEGVGTLEVTVPVETRTLFDGATSIRLLGPTATVTAEGQAPADAAGCADFPALGAPEPRSR